MCLPAPIDLDLIISRSSVFCLHSAQQCLVVAFDSMGIAISCSDQIKQEINRDTLLFAPVGCIGEPAELADLTYLCFTSVTLKCA